jgi:predicted membrane channel-forming protein YqfA (hemolysin III family)
MSYQPMPVPPPPGRPVAKGPAPAGVLLAVRLMFVNVALGVIGLIFVLTLKGQIRDQLRNQYPNYTSSHIDDLASTATVIAGVVAVIFIVLYALLALQVQKGRNWARIVTFVLAGLGVLSALSTLAQHEPVLNKVLGIIQGVLDVAIIVLLARAESQPYFRRRSYY